MLARHCTAIAPHIGSWVVKDADDPLPVMPQDCYCQRWQLRVYGQHHPQCLNRPLWRAHLHVLMQEQQIANKDLPSLSLNDDGTLGVHLVDLAAVAAARHPEVACRLLLLDTLPAGAEAWKVGRIVSDLAGEQRTELQRLLRLQAVINAKLRMNQDGKGLKPEPVTRQVITIHDWDETTVSMQPVYDIRWP